jgi:hypothetical protein
MTFKQPSLVQFNQIKDRIKNLIEIGTCQVCGDKARVVNYGALSCPSCKTFFRRHGFHAEV